MITIEKDVELKKVLCGVDGNAIFTVGKSGSVLTFVDEWDEITSDVMASKTFNHTQGITSFGPKALVASPGKFTFSLNNTSFNSASKAGYYSLDHTNIRDGFEQGSEVRVKYTYNGSTGFVWRGKIFDIRPDPSPHKAFTRVVCYDWMKSAQDHKFRALDVAIDQTGDEAITALVTTLPNSKQPQSTSYDVGKSTFPYVFDSERDEKTTVRSVFQKVAQSELGKIYVNHQAGGGEQLVFENRHHPKEESTVQYDFDDSVVSVKTNYPFDQIKTKVIVVAHPREVNTGDVVLGRVRKPFQVQAGDSRIVKILYRDPEGEARISANSLLTRVSGTDFIANADEDGGGADRTADLAVTESERSGNSIALCTANNGASAFWVTTLQQRGKGLYLYDPVVYETEENSTYIALSGKSELRFDLPYEDDYNVAVDYGDYLLSSWRDPIVHVSGLSYFPEVSTGLADAFFDIDIGKRITVNLTQIGIDQDYFVQHISTSWHKGKLRVSYNVAPAGAYAYATLDDAVYGKLDADECKLAF